MCEPRGMGGRVGTTFARARGRACRISVSGKGAWGAERMPALDQAVALCKEAVGITQAMQRDIVLKVLHTWSTRGKHIPSVQVQVVAGRQGHRQVELPGAWMPLSHQSNSQVVRGWRGWGGRPEGTT